MGYEVGGKIQVQWWRQVAADNQLQVTIEDILVAARLRRQQESERCGKSKGGSEREMTYSEGWGRGWEHRYTVTEIVDSQVSR